MQFLMVAIKINMKYRRNNLNYLPAQNLGY